MRFTYRRALALFKPHWRTEVKIFAGMLLGAALGLIPGFVTAHIIDHTLPSHRIPTLLRDGGMLICSTIASALITVWQGKLTVEVGQAIMRDIRTSLARRLFHMPVNFFTDTRAGEILTHISNDVDAVAGIVNGTFATVATAILTFGVTFVAMFLWNWRLGLVAALVVPLMVLPVHPMSNRMYTAQKSLRKARDKVEHAALEALSVSGIMLMKTFLREEHHVKAFQEAGTLLMQREVEASMVGRWFGAAISAMSVVGPTMLWIAGGWLVMHGSMSIGVIVAFVYFIQARLYGPAASLANVHVQMSNAAAVLERIFGYLDLPTERYESFATAPLSKFDSSIRFENVTFAYGDRNAVKDVTLNICTGTTAAFVGHSGSGKTTLAYLLLRFYEPTAGTITLGNRRLADYGLHELRSVIGVVAQETHLFYDTIRDNLRYAKPDATDDEIEAAAKLAQIHNFIIGLPSGYDTIVGERGMKLSGGERQRIAIARIFLKNPPVVILDEATSHLDSTNEAAVRNALIEVTKKRTTVIIAHRLSTILHADTVFVMERGRIMEAGAPHVLLSANGAFSRLFAAQQDMHESQA